MSFLSFIGLGKGKEQIIEAIKNDSLIVDVRSKEEFDTGHVSGAINIPLDSLGNKILTLDAKGKPIVFCCASGMRSGKAVRQAKSLGLEAYNGGGWMSLNSLVETI